MYLESLARYLSTIESSDPIDDKESIQSIAHKIRGTASTYGIEGLSEAAKQTEHTLRESQDSAQIQKSVEFLVNLLRSAIDDK